MSFPLALPQARETRGGGASPDQHLALVVPGDLVHLNDFLLEELQQVIVQLELDLERALGDTSATLQHLQGLLQDLVKGHGLPSIACALLSSGNRGKT